MPIVKSSWSRPRVQSGIAEFEASKLSECVNGVRQQQTTLSESANCRSTICT